MRPVRRLVVIESCQNYDRAKCLGIAWCCLKEGRVVEVELITQKTVWSKNHKNIYSSPIVQLLISSLFFCIKLYIMSFKEVLSTFTENGGLYT
jgi:hypothetical protein